MKKSVVVACVLAIGPTLHAALTQDIEYGNAGGVSLRLDAFVPDGTGPFPAVIMVHGGGWNTGDKSGGRTKGYMAPMDDPLARAGFAWFEINYRLTPKYLYPACIEDVETAIRWVKAHAAEYHLDPGRIALAGESSGGHLVDLAAARADPSTRVAAVVSFYGAYDLVYQAKAKPTDSNVAKLFGLAKVEEKDLPLLHEASADAYLKPGLPPFLLVHGDEDPKVPFDEDVAFRAKLLALGVPCELITIHGGGHGMNTWDKVAPGYKDEVVAWLQKTLPPHPWRYRFHKLFGI
jgi:alpha-L-fucosidase 2